METRIFLLLFWLISIAISEIVPPGAFSITRIHYGGGGDWYADPSSLPNLLEYLKNNTNVIVNPLEMRSNSLRIP